MSRWKTPTPPTASLPKLSTLATCTLEQIANTLENLQSIYYTLPLPKALPSKHLSRHLIHDLSTPDSGYASAEDAEDEEDIEQASSPGQDSDLDILRSDAFEREFAIRWLTGFTARSEAWVYDESVQSDESDVRAALVDSAVSILAAFAGKEEEALTRRFVFPCQGQHEAVEVELNDAPLLSEDYTSVGLQSWASSILLSERLCASLDAFGLVKPGATPLRILELGAGTGLLSIATAKIMQRFGHDPCIISTDYHPSVLENLQANVDTNFSTCVQTPIIVRALDWSRPLYDGALARPFDLILAADVIYHPEHARWIKTCVEHLLVRPPLDKGVFWLIIPLRIAGYHEGMSGTVEDVLPLAANIQSAEEAQLAIITIEQLEKHAGVGRADEGGYKLYKIGWV